MNFRSLGSPAAEQFIAFFDIPAGFNNKLSIKGCTFEGLTKGQDQLGSGGMYGCDISQNNFLNGNGQGMGIAGSIG